MRFFFALSITAHWIDFRV